MSFLGTSRYVPAHYKLGEEVSKLTPFVQEALVSLICRDWTAEDRLIFFLTPEAQNKNWKDGGNFPQGLYTRLKTLRLAPEICPVSFTEGQSEEEIRQNFLTIVEQLKENDEVYFDITHSFRSLPMLNLVALNYARVLKNIHIEGILYGAFEILGYPKEVEEKVPPEKRLAPVFDLTPYALLLDWSFAVEEFVRYGLAKRLTELVKEEIQPIIKETRGKDEKAQTLKTIVNQLRALTLNIYTCRCQKIEETRLSKNLFEKLKTEELLPPFKPLLEHIEDKIKAFLEEDSWEKAQAAVEWCITHGLVQQGYTILQEAVITEVSRLAGFKDVFDPKNRNFISSLLAVTALEKTPEKWRGELERRQEKALALQAKFGDSFKQLASAFSSLTNVRNDINHCGCRQDPLTADQLIQKLKKQYEQIKNALAELKLASNS